MRLRSAAALIWVSLLFVGALGACVAEPEAEPEVSEGNGGLGDVCNNTLDCGSSFECLATRGGRVCAETCQSATDCSQPGAACSPIPGGAAGFCDVFGMDNPPIDDGPVATYPAGPYGTAIGDTVENHTVINSDGTSLRLSDIHADPSNKVLLVYNTVSYCQSCAAKSVELTELNNTLGPRGLVPMIALFENLNFQPAQPEDAAKYKERLNIDFTVTADAPGTFHPYFAELVHPMVIIIETETMTILYKDVSWLRGPIDEILQEHL